MDRKEMLGDLELGTYGSPKSGVPFWTRDENSG